MGTLAAVNVVDVQVAHAALAVGPACAASCSRSPGGPASAGSELGLGPGTWRRGFTWAGVEIGAVAVVIAVGAALPLTRQRSGTRAIASTRGRAAHRPGPHPGRDGPAGGDRVPRGAVGTAPPRGGTTTATIVSSLLFGLWHVLPSLGLATDNEAIGSAVGRGRSAQVLTVLGTVAFTTLAGVVFCELRRRSGSILASAGLHWATNALSVLAAAAVWAWGTH